MFIKINEKNEITAFATFGNLNDSIEFDGTVPDDFLTNFAPRFYMMLDKKIVTNPAYVAPQTPTDFDIKPQDEINAMLLKEFASLQAQLGGGNGA